MPICRISFSLGPLPPRPSRPLLTAHPYLNLCNLLDLWTNLVNLWTLIVLSAHRPLLTAHCIGYVPGKDLSASLK